MPIMYIVNGAKALPGFVTESLKSHKNNSFKIKLHRVIHVFFFLLKEGRK